MASTGRGGTGYTQFEGVVWDEPGVTFEDQYQVGNYFHQTPRDLYTTYTYPRHDPPGEEPWRLALWDYLLAVVLSLVGMAVCGV